MKTLIIEDESLTAGRLQGMLHKYDPRIEVSAVIPSVGEAVEWFKNHPDPDLIFMDIHLEDEHCFSIFEQINLEAPIIFTTAYDEYMIKAFKVNSIDYLMKPVNYEELTNALEKFKRLRQQYGQNNIEQLLKTINNKEPEYKNRFLVNGYNKLISVEVEKVAYFYSTDKITFLVTTDNQHLPVDYSIDKLTLLLDPRYFFRINRQVLVKLSAIHKMHVYPKGKIRLELQPDAKREIYVSMDKITPFKEWLGK
jgi:DNA-binding LytR/AlgR family response regulator